MLALFPLTCTPLAPDPYALAPVLSPPSPPAGASSSFSDLGKCSDTSTTSKPGAAAVGATGDWGAGSGGERSRAPIMAAAQATVLTKATASATAVAAAQTATQSALSWFSNRGQQAQGASAVPTAGGGPSRSPSAREPEKAPEKEESKALVAQGGSSSGSKSLWAAAATVTASVAVAGVSAWAASAATPPGPAPRPIPAPPPSRAPALPPPPVATPNPLRDHPYPPEGPQKSPIGASDEDPASSSAVPPNLVSELNHPLYNAGRLYYIQRRGVDPTASHRVVRVVSGESFTRLLIKRSMLGDHYLDRYQEAVQSALNAEL
jgi:hypothetical protein